jgi:uncharacterized protein
VNAPKAIAGEALVRVEWPRVLFLHYRIAPELLRPYVPRHFEIDLYDNSAWLTLVALTMRNFRPCRPLSIPGWLLRCCGEQRFLNVRTYIRCGEERGAFFLWGWLSRPFHLPAPERPFRLPCGFAEITYKHGHEGRELSGTVGGREGAFIYSASLPTGTQFSPPASGSLAAFALECYSGFYSHRGRARIFRAWHEPWHSTPLDVTLHDEGLLQTQACLHGAKFTAAHYTPGLSDVLLGGAHKFETPHSRHGASAFFTMP